MHQDTPLPEGWQGHVFDPEHHIPVRKVPKSAAAITGFYWSKKMRRHVGHESLLEKRLFQVLEESDGIWRYLEQPFRIPVVGENGALQQYTPDLLVVFVPPPNSLRRIEPLLIEVKPATKVAHWVQKNGAKVLAAAGFARRCGMNFRVVTDQEIVDRRSLLIQWLEERPLLCAEDPIRLEILRMIAKGPGMTFLELLRRLEMQGCSRFEVSDRVGALLREGYLRWDRGCGTLADILRLRNSVQFYLPPSFDRQSMD
jgi:hypothetical protein